MNSNVAKLSHEALTLLNACPRLSWSLAGRIGSGTHVAKVMDGPGDHDIFALVESSWGDANFIASFPLALTSLLHCLAYSDPGLADRVFGERVDRTFLTPAQVESLYKDSTPGPWQLQGQVSVDVGPDLETPFDVSGRIKLMSASPPTRLLATVAVFDLADASSLSLICEGRALIPGLLASC